MPYVGVAAGKRKACDEREADKDRSRKIRLERSAANTLGFKVLSI